MQMKKISLAQHNLTNSYLSHGGKLREPVHKQILVVIF